MNDEIRQACIFCKSTKVIRHGKTTTGNKRYRCRTCGKTWVHEKMESSKPDLSYIVEEYLNGKTCRDLVGFYHSSPLRINQKIREFLDGCPNWEEYLDINIAKHEPKLVYLVGRNFSCSCKGSGSTSNTMFLAMAIDALSTVVLGYQIGPKDEIRVWDELLTRMNTRNIACQTFMTNGSKHIDEAVGKIYPESTIRIYYHRAFRDKEITCCLDRFPINHKLINDSLKAYEGLKDQTLNSYLKQNYDMRLKDVLNSNADQFIRRIKERIENRPKIRIEGLVSAFQVRFEKFHMLKDDPTPLVNGWITKWMLETLDFGFSRMSVYMQVPARTLFKNFSCGQKPVILKLEEDNRELKAFVIEVAARSLQIPQFYSKCEMNLEKCHMF